jgi:hypothetical protein
MPLTTLQEYKWRVAVVVGAACRICGTTPVHYAHVRPTKCRGRGRGSVKRYADILKHPECYAPLCSLHHLQFDMGKIKLS